MIPTIDIEPLFGPASPAPERTDAAIMQEATGTGFMAITGPLDLIAPTPAARAGLLRLFALPPAGSDPETTPGRLLRRFLLSVT